jgi:glycopeptide antibiotics resistance protein
MIVIMLMNQKLIQVKSLSKAVLITYLIMLTWLVLFKFSFDVISVLETYQARSLNLNPFMGHMREMIDNFIVFIPFGLLLSINFKQVAFWKKLAFISVFSLAIEIIQFALAIGVTDITDVAMNTLGGLFGLISYDFCKKYIDSKKMDLFIIAVGTLLLIIFLILRLFVFRVRY